MDKGPSSQDNRFKNFAPVLGTILLTLGIGGYAPVDFQWKSDETIFLIFIALAGICFCLKPAKKIGRFVVGCMAVSVILPMFFAVLALTPEKESAFAALPFLTALMTVFFCARRLSQANVLLILICIFFLGSLSFSSIDQIETVVWFLGVFLWLLGVHLNRKYRIFSSGNTLLWGGIFWLLIILSIVTLDALITRTIPFHSLDSQAAGELFSHHPLLGIGLGGADSAYVTVSNRSPELGGLYALSGLRLLAEIGLFPVIAFLIGFSCLIVSSFKKKCLNSDILGAISLIILALLNSHESPYIYLVVLALLIPLSQKSPDVESESVRKCPILLSSILLLLLTLYFPFTIALWKRNQPPDPLVRPQVIYTYWSKPHQDRSWWIRDKSIELINFTDPREHLKESSEAWLWRTPHSELALIEWIRLQHKTLPIGEMDAVTLAAYQQNPWYDPIALWHVRILTDQNEIEKAHIFLTEHAKKQTKINPVVLNRLSDLGQLIQEQQP